MKYKASLVKDIKNDKNLMSCGIYLIVNTFNNNSYVGSTSKSFRLRWLQHLNSLKRGNHANKHIQNSFNKYSIDSFEFLII